MSGDAIGAIDADAANAFTLSDEERRSLDVRPAQNPAVVEAKMKFASQRRKAGIVGRRSQWG